MKRALIAALLACTACKTLEGDATKPDYASDAQTNIKRGREALDNKSFVEAASFFEYVKVKYPFLDASKEAELGLADTDFDREQFVEARDAYQNFVKIHPTHPRVDYAAFRAALTHQREMPSDFFLLPPPEEKDQTSVRAALIAFQDFVRTYPKSTYLPEAEAYVQSTRTKLAQHEWYVAEFYKRRQRWNAVAARLERLLKDFPKTSLDEKAFFGLHEAYVHLKDRTKADETLKRIEQDLAGTPAAARAKQMLGT